MSALLPDPMNRYPIRPSLWLRVQAESRLASELRMRGWTVENVLQRLETGRKNVALWRDCPLSSRYAYRLLNAVEYLRNRQRLNALRNFR